MARQEREPGERLLPGLRSVTGSRCPLRLRGATPTLGAVVAVRRRRALVLAAVLLTGGCAETRPPAAVPQAGMLGGWELVEGTADGTPIPRPPGGRATLDVEADTLGGTAFCNGYGGNYQLDAGRLRLENAGATEMACAPELMAAEEAYLTVFFAGELRATVDGDQLTLESDAGALRFRQLPPPPVSALVGTEWLLETLVEEETATSTASEPVLRLSADGGLHATTGCRTLTGRWRANGSTVVVPELRADGECPPALGEQDEHVVGVLGDGFRAQVDGDRLTLTAPGGVGLVYRAG